MDKEFNQANQKVHNVEDQWHYKILTAYGFQPETKSAVGFVRQYEYVNDKGIKIICSTGSRADYWSVVSTDGSPAEHGGYWASLEPYLQSIS